MSTLDRSLYFPGGRTGILLIHGLAGTPLQMRYVARALARAGYTVHCPQLAGHSGALEDLRATGWTDWYATCETALKELKGECDDVIVGGLSGGSLLALHLAADHPRDVLGTVAYAPPLKLDGWSIPWYIVFFNLIRHKWFAEYFRFDARQPYGIKDPRLRAIVTKEMQGGESSRAGQAVIPGGLLLELRWLAKALSRKLGMIAQPVLLMHAREDDRASLRNTARLQAALGGLVETVVLDDSYHIVTMDKQRDIVVERTVAFADALAPSKSGVQGFKIRAAE